MLDFLTIFTKGGIVLWYFQGTVGSFTIPVNDLIQNVLLSEKGGVDTFSHGPLALKYKLDNEFELVFVVGYQRNLQLAYVDKVLTDIQKEFRDKYKNQLEAGSLATCHFDSDFHRLLRDAEMEHKNKKNVMRSFDETKKAQRIRENKGELAIPIKKGTKKQKLKAADLDDNKENVSVNSEMEVDKANEVVEEANGIEEEIAENGDAQEMDDEEQEMMKRRELLMKGMLKGGGKKKPVKKEKPVLKASGPAKKEKKKEGRIWDNGGTTKDMEALDFSKSEIEEGKREDAGKSTVLVGSMKGDLKGIDVDYDLDSAVDKVDSVVEDQVNNSKKDPEKTASGASSFGGGFFSFFKGLAGQKAITKDAMAPVLDKMREHLCSKNVATDISEKLCDSVARKLEGKVLGTFTGVASAVRGSMEESLVQILSPKKKIDILRDIKTAKANCRPFVIVFCGVNGVGKSTNLAKICFWLLENNHRVMIAACDTFRSGAVEQLRTHTRHLNSLHPPSRANGPPSVVLYDKGYGKDAAGVAMEAVNQAQQQRIDVVLVDTAGRMQNNEPLMRSLAKLIKINDPNLVLFVGEALVGNDGVDQLKSFNQALADHSGQDNPRLIDGIVLTKFDTIDDKVGAAISMTYTTGQPIVFVGIGQTYSDLRSLDVNSIVKALLKS
ncbi:signal recognition particle receptor subunit alpha-like [Rhopilema esculentum]|uniref:signal recognition particle receptor subunit alpha-like n=1 Tax=Rhopilema esculentum TaxID=499914 RepID=UPI0031E0DFF2|eukprot:gene16384-7786_t